MINELLAAKDDIMALQRCSNKSLQQNAAINTFVDLEKLTLSKKKSHNVHIGKQTKSCPSLKVHGNRMDTTNQETYLGDIVHKSGKGRPNIEARKAKGYGIINNILAIVNEVPLGQWKVDAGLRLRQAMLVNGVLFNSEAWHNVSMNDLILLEKVDEALLRGLVNGHAKIPLEALFLETSSIPIRFIVSSRRIMYLHSILQKSPEELVRRVFEAQKADTSPGDFCELVSEDKDILGINMSDQEIGSMSKCKLKKIVKNNTKEAAFKYLQSLKESHSKLDGLEYSNFEKASYLSSPLFRSEDMRLLLGLRTRTVNGIRNDFRGMYADNMCPLNCGEVDTLPHILQCSVIKLHHTNSMLAQGDITYQDIFSSNVVRQKQVTELYRQLLDIRIDLLDSQPVAVTGPVQCV